MSNSTKKWYALYTKSGCEKRVANLLSRKNIENYCPLKRQLNGRKKMVWEPLFNSYVFIQVKETGMPEIRMMDNVINFVYWLGEPAIVSNEEIETMKQFMNEYVDVQLEKMPLGADRSEREMGEPLADNKQMLFVSNGLVKIILPSLGYMVLAAVEEKSAVKVISSKDSYSVVEKYRYAI